MYYTFLSIKL